MEIELASKLLGVATAVVLAINVYMATQPFRRVAGSVEVFRAMVRSGEIGWGTISFSLVLIYFALPLAFIWLLWQAGFYGLGLWVPLGKLCLSGALAAWWQVGIASGKMEYSNQTFRVQKVDYLLNIVLMVGVLAILWQTI